MLAVDRSRHQTVDRTQKTAGSRQQAPDSRQNTADSRQKTEDRRQQTADSLPLQGRGKEVADTHSGQTQVFDGLRKQHQRKGGHQRLKGNSVTTV
jgi:hypothetical protein